jgi:hypothetical protein
MFALRAALFLWQKDSFSFRDTQSFNRNSSTQVAMHIDLIDFSTCYSRIFMRIFAI